MFYVDAICEDFVPCMPVTGFHHASPFYAYSTTSPIRSVLNLHERLHEDIRHDLQHESDARMVEIEV